MRPLPLVVVLAAFGCAHAKPASPPTGSPTPTRTPAVSIDPGPRSRSPGLEDLVGDDLAEDHAFPWSAARPLIWSDFQADPPAGGAEGAVTAYGLYYAWKCLGEAFEFRVIAGFRPRQSWVKAVVVGNPAESRRTLRHEQTHFDLSEVHARMMRRSFANLTGACRRRDGELTGLARRLLDEEKAEQRRYDGETNHGLDSAQQAAWNQAVARRLTALRRYAP